MRIGRFISVGLAATAAYAILATLSHHYLPFAAAISSGLAYGVCALGSWFGHRFITFHDVQPKQAAPLVFFAISASGHASSILIPAVLSDMNGLHTGISTLVTCTVIPLVSAVLTSRLVFGASLFAKQSHVARQSHGERQSLGDPRSLGGAE